MYIYIYTIHKGCANCGVYGSFNPFWGSVEGSRKGIFPKFWGNKKFAATQTILPDYFQGSKSITTQGVKNPEIFANKQICCSKLSNQLLKQHR